MAARIHELRADLNQKIQAANAAAEKAVAAAQKEKRALTAEEVAADATFDQEITSAKALLAMEEKRIEREKATVIADPEPEKEATKPGKGKFATLGQQLQTVVKAARGDEGARQWLAASGLNESLPAEGGVAVQQDLASGMLQKTYLMGEVASRVQRVTVGANANGLKLLALKENSRVNGSRWGGVQAYWVDEAGTFTATKPDFRTIDLNLKKLTGAAYLTDELLQDAAALESVVTQSFQSEMTFKIEDAIVNGTGAGQPLGIMPGGAAGSAVVTQAIEAAQTIANTAGSIATNLAKMWSRMFAPCQKNAAWFVNPDLLAKLYVATLGGTSAVSGIFIAPGRLNETPYATIFGRPVIPFEYGQAEGTPGDILLLDLSQYVCIEKGGVQSASSIHVRFLNDETTLRFVYRFDGSPVWNSALTPYKGSSTVSPFIALNTRS